MFILTFLALVPLASTGLVPLSSFSQDETLYKINKTSKVYVISNSPQNVIQSLVISTEKGGQNSNGYTLAVPQTDGSLTPLQSTSDGDYLNVKYTGTNTATGWLYINHLTSDLNVFPLSEGSSVSFKSGTNVFFRFVNSTDIIPVAENVVLGSSVDFSGFVGLPDETDPTQFFDSSSIKGVTQYSQLELPMHIFHFTSSGTNVVYTIKYSNRTGMAIGSAGLVMTNGYPTGDYATRDFSLVNSNNGNIELFLVPRLDKSQIYSGNVTVFNNSTEPTVFPLLSNADSNITSTGPMNRVVIESDGPFAVQYSLKDLSITTPAPVQTTTKSSNVPRMLVSLLTATILCI